MGNKIVVNKGDQFGYWTALGEEKKEGRCLFDKCQCECGTVKFVRHDHLIHGRSTNCGCKTLVVRSNNGKNNKKHGMEGTKPYRVFMSAKTRCNNTHNKRYGGRGIKFEWLTFESFRNDMKDDYYKHISEYGESNTTLDRIDNDGNYCKDNCRWATKKEQANNKSSNHNVTYKGKFYNTISELCKDLGLKYSLIRDRLRLGRDVDKAIETPLYIQYSINVKQKD